MITFKTSGGFKKTTRFLERAKEIVRLGNLDEYGRKGVEALSAATPIESGETASSWYYKIEHNGTTDSLIWCNSHVVNGCPIAIIIQYGHATRNGGYVQGIDYINPAIQPIIQEIANEINREVKRL